MGAEAMADTDSDRRAEYVRANWRVRVILHLFGSLSLADKRVLAARLEEGVEALRLGLRRLDADAPAPPLEGGDWGLGEDLDDGRMGQTGGLGDGAER
jgi:hypothetical protein